MSPSTPTSNQRTLYCDMARISYRPLPEAPLDEEQNVTNEPKKRRPPNTFFCLLSAFPFLIILCYKWKTQKDPTDFDVFSIVCSLLIGSQILFFVGFAETVYFLATLWEEWKNHFPSYSYSNWKLFKEVFKEHKRAIYFVLSSAILWILWLILHNQLKEADSSNGSTHIALVLSFVCILHCYNLFKRVPNKFELKILSEMMLPLVYAVDIAKGYHIGYLRLILPYDTGSDKYHSLSRRIVNFEQENGISIPIKKLFIIIPQSCYLCSDLSSNVVPNSRMMLDKQYTLRDLILERGGTDRKYTNAVYRFRYNDGDSSKEVFLVAEVASPLFTMLEMSMSKSSQVLLFYIRLKELLEADVRCKGLYVLVYYNDEDEPKDNLHAALKRKVVEELSLLPEPMHPQVSYEREIQPNRRSLGEIEVDGASA